MYGMVDMIGNIKKMMNGNPQVLYESMMKNNKQFAEFVKTNDGKSPEDIARSYGIDPDILKQLFK